MSCPGVKYSVRPLVSDASCTLVEIKLEVASPDDGKRELTAVLPWSAVQKENECVGMELKKMRERIDKQNGLVTINYNHSEGL